MNQLPLARGNDGRLQMAGFGHVTLSIEYAHILGRGGHAVVFAGEILSNGGDQDGFYGQSELVMKVAVKVHADVEDPRRELQREGRMHARAWTTLNHVVKPVGSLTAHAPTGTPAALVMEVAVPFRVFLARNGPLGCRNIDSVKAITRVTYQLLRFIVEADAINFMHKDVKAENMLVRNAENLQLVELAVADFGGSQSGVSTEDGDAIYRPGVYTWHQTSPRMASYIYEQMATQSMPREAIELTRQLTFFNDLFGWARIAFLALADQSPPDILYGPSAEDYYRVPALGYGEVLDAVRHLLQFALDLLTVGSIEEVVDNEYVRSLEWYDALQDTLSV